MALSNYNKLSGSGSGGNKTVRSEQRHRRILLGSLLVFIFSLLLSHFLISGQIVHRLEQNNHNNIIHSSTNRGGGGGGEIVRALTEFKNQARQKEEVDNSEEEKKKDVIIESTNTSSSITTTTTTTTTPIDNPPPQNGNETFSACLLVMDDNHRLVEWLAYHYHLLPLRYLIVAVDPRSKTSPTEILNRYRRLGMYIQEWTDHDFLAAKLANNTIPEDARLQLKRDRHRARQKVFYRTCLLKLKEANRTYVTLHDTDEYLVYNHAGGDRYSQWEATMQAKHDQSRNRGQKRIPPFHAPPPTTAQGGTMLQYIKDEKASGYKGYQTPCISIPRMHFSAAESTPEERAKDTLTASATTSATTTTTDLDPAQFDTLRWRKHSARNDFVKNNLAKVILDVSEVDIASTPRFKSLHRPVPTICHPPWVNDWETGLRFNHYLGSWESYSFRDDSRRGGERSRETWEFQAEDQDDTDDNIRPWLSGFVKTHGPDKASELLKGVGLPKTYHNQNESAWKSAWLEDILKSNETEGTNPKNHEFDEFVRRKYQTK